VDSRDICGNCHHRKIKIKLSDIATRPLEPHFQITPDRRNIMLKSIKKYGYDPKRFKSWIKVARINGAPKDWEDASQYSKIYKFLLQDGKHRVDVCKHLYEDDYKIEAFVDESVVLSGPPHFTIHHLDMRGMKDE